MKAIVATVITALVIAVIFALAIFYVIRSKKKGRKCIGCPTSGSCPSANGGCCSCSYSSDTNE